jgi:hypothetical protein
MSYYAFPISERGRRRKPAIRIKGRKVSNG